MYPKSSFSLVLFLALLVCVMSLPTDAVIQARSGLISMHASYKIDGLKPRAEDTTNAVTGTITQTAVEGIPAHRDSKTVMARIRARITRHGGPAHN